ncbi:MAG: class I SAM-dependent methyltransferase [Alicyclobacillus sp.]|nr:class I SAM-dependent methyltransferase [Alicyclobacillus sp.]
MRDSEVQKQRVIEQFGRTAAAYVSSASHANADALARMLTALKPNRDWLVLDVATGGGHVAKAVAPFVRQVVALDITSNMLRAARDHLASSGIDNALPVLGDAEELPFLDQTFDAVTCRIAAHHFPNPERFLEQSARVLKRGGTFLLIDNITPADRDVGLFYNRVERMRDDSHVRCLSEEEWLSRLEAAGLDVGHRETSVKRFAFQSWVRRMVDDEQKIKEIESMLLAADEKAKSSLDIEIVNGQVESFCGLEWMCVCVKR